jgi:pyruvate/2-oxoglutarate dehydrogenase complex dihydrolipoamide acyltransferase (E2) component
LTLQQALQVAARIMAKGERSAAKIVSNMREVIRAQPGTEIEYLSICHPETLHELDTVEVRTLVALAVRVGRARLIDNTLFDLRELSQRADLNKPMKPAATQPAGGGVKAAAKAAAAPAAKAAAKPATKPAVKPAGKPSPKPAAKSGVKPASKPAARPAVSPDLARKTPRR